MCLDRISTYGDFDLTMFHSYLPRYIFVKRILKLNVPIKRFRTLPNAIKCGEHGV